jgi:hypothetical protein
MKPNQNQQLQLQQYLCKNLKYRETYAEFYDHILSALETLPGDISFDDASQKIIAEDFGGLTGMRLIENKYQRSVFAEMKKKYFSYAIENLKFSRLILWIVFIATTYYLFEQPWFTFTEFFVMLVAIRFVPILLQLARHLNTTRTVGAPKRSVKSNFFRWLDKGQFGLILLWLAGMPRSFRSAGPLQATLTEIFMTVFCLAVALHTYNFYRVYEDDIRTSFTTN